MTYTKTSWVNNSTPAINASNLNNMETGIDDVHPRIFYALGADTSNLGTSLATVVWDTPARSDTGYSDSSGVITITSALNGKWAEFFWSVGGSGANNRVEIRTELQIDPDGVSGFTAEKVSDNYTARNATQDTGGIQGFHVHQLATGMKIQIQALRDGSTVNKIKKATSLYIKTVD